MAGLQDLQLDLVSGASLAGFEERAAALDPGTILLIFGEARGERVIPGQAAKRITALSAAPSRGVYHASLDDGRDAAGGADGLSGAPGASAGGRAGPWPASVARDQRARSREGGTPKYRLKARVKCAGSA